MTTTRRQTHFLIACVILVAIFIFLPQETITDHEFLIIALIGFPLGIYLATDPERTNKKAPEGAS